MTTTETTLAAGLRAAATIAATRWEPRRFGVNSILEQVGSAASGPDTIDMWDAVVTHLNEELIVHWERQPGRTRADVAAMLNAAAVSSGGAR